MDIQRSTVTVKIINFRVVILEKTAEVNVNNTISLHLAKEDVTGWDDLRIEFKIILEDGTIHKFPKNGWYKIQIIKNLDNLSIERIAYVTLETSPGELKTETKEVPPQARVDQRQTTYAKNEGDSAKQQGQALVDEIILINNRVDILQKNQGALTGLPTNDKESIVSAIKEENKKRRNQEYFVSLTDFPRIAPETVDTPRIQRAIDSMAMTGGILFVPSSTYLISGPGVNLVSNIKILGEGNKKTVFKASYMSLDSNMFSGTSESDIVFDGVGFDGANDPHVRRAIYISARGTDKFLRIKNCRFINFSKSNNQTIYTWNSRFIWVTENEFVDCVIPMFIDAADRAVFIERNTITSPSGIMVNGIQVHAGAKGIRPINISNNWIENVKIDATGNGIDGHGIRLYRCEGAKVMGNTVRDCVTSAILVGTACWGSSILTNTIYDNKTGIYVELNNEDITLGAGDVKRGAIVNANDCFNNTTGIAVSYGAGSQIVANFVHNNNKDGIMCDSHSVGINNNTVYNNWKNTSATSPIQLVKAGIRNYGYNGTHIGNICFDNQIKKTQDYGIAINNASHIVGMNQLKGNGIGGVYESATGTNQISMNVIS
ncbi:right-handed parallel beta-helix repeat-containing protein [Priestia filamentosa]